ncbi:MAG: type IIL restriction-modification enzyme MmeI [Rhodomicrobium sp.]
MKSLVLPTRQEAAQRENDRNKQAIQDDKNARVNNHHANFLRHWWLLSYRRSDLMELIFKIPRYIACGQVTKRPIFEFISSSIHPNAALVVFPKADDYSFGVLQSSAHWSWFTERCSTLREDFRYTSSTVFNTFPWPQFPNKRAVEGIAKASRTLVVERRALCEKYGKSLRQLYRDVELPGEHPLDELQEVLDAEVRKAYGMSANSDPLKFLFELNKELAAKEAKAEPISGPGLPPEFAGDQTLTSDYCVKVA